MQQSLLALFFSQLWYEKNRAPPNEYRMGKNYWHAKNLIWNIRLAKVWKSFADIFSICIVFIFYILDAAFFVPLYFSFFPFSFADGEESNFTWNFIKLGIITVPVCCVGPSLEGGKGNNRLLLFLIYLIMVLVLSFGSEMSITLLHLMLMSKIYVVNSDMRNVIGMSDPNVIFKGPVPMNLQQMK